MVECCSKKCGELVEIGWIFCPFCGTDNRPPAYRPFILNCSHLFFESEGFCVRCGDCRDGRRTAAQRENQSEVGKILFIGGFIAVLACLAVWQIRVHSFPGSAWISTWYDIAYDASGRTVLKGDDYMSWAGSMGSVLCVMGLMAMVVARMNIDRRQESGARSQEKGVRRQTQNPYLS